MLLKIAYMLTCRVLSLTVLVFRSDLAKNAELLVLQYENAVLRRHVGWVRYEPTDQAWFTRPGAAYTAQALGRSLPVTLATLLA